MKYLKHILIALTLLASVFIVADYKEEKNKTAQIQEDYRLELLDQKLQLETIQKRLTAAVIGNSALREEILGASNAIPTAVALYEDQLSTKMLKTDTTFTMVSGTYNNGANSLASSTYAFIVNEGTSDEEMIIADCTATACTGAIRGIDRLTGNTEVSSLKHTHRRGSSIKITDGPQLLILSRIINGNENFPNALTFDGKLTYSTAPSITNILDIPDKQYVDNSVNQGAATATEAVAGIAELATLAEQASGTPWGATEPHVMASENATSSPDGTVSAYYALILNSLGKIAQSAIDLTQSFTFTDNVTVTGTSTFATTTISSLTVDNKVISTSFGGDGTDGTLTITAGTTTIDLGGADYVIKNYTSISITGTGTLAFSNKGTNGTVVVLKSQGDVTITSTTSPAISVSYLGASASLSGIGNIGGAKLGTAGVGATAGDGGDGAYSLKIPLGKMVPLYVGGGAGDGGGAGVSGAGGDGAGALYIEVGGYLNITSTIQALGQNGTVGDAQGSSDASGGGGGGARTKGGDGGGSVGQTTCGGGGGGGGGVIVILYNYLTTNSGTYTVTGGNGAAYGGANGGVGYYYVGLNNDL